MRGGDTDPGAQQATRTHKSVARAQRPHERTERYACSEGMRTHEPWLALARRPDTHSLHAHRGVGT